MARKVTRPSAIAGGGGGTKREEEEEGDDLYSDPYRDYHNLHDNNTTHRQASSTPAPQPALDAPSFQSSSPANPLNSFSDKENIPLNPRQRGSNTSPLVKKEKGLNAHSARSAPYTIPSHDMPSGTSKASRASAAPKESRASTAKPISARSSIAASRAPSVAPSRIASRAISRVAETPAPGNVNMEDEEEQEEHGDGNTQDNASESEEESSTEGSQGPTQTQRSRVSETPAPPSKQSRQRIQSQAPPASPPPGTQGEVWTQFYDPNQSMAERRRVKGAYNDIQQELIDNRAKFLQPGNQGLLQYIEKTGELFNNVKQTSDAVVDGKIQVEIGKLAAEKAKKVGNSTTNTGLNIDEFIAKCIQFMGKSRPGDTSDGHDWAYLGTQVATPSMKRACPSDFMYGPMAIQKRQRLVKERKRAVRRRPEEFIRPIDLDEKAIAKNENSTTKNVLVVSQALDDYLVETGEEQVNYFAFVINPHSYSQTIENMFYLAFLIRDGRVGMTEDEDGLLWLMAAEPPTPEETAAHGIVRKQVVMPMEKHIWRELIDAFQIKDAIIATRPREVEAINGSGWYS